MNAKRADIETQLSRDQAEGIYCVNGEIDIADCPKWLRVALKDGEYGLMALEAETQYKAICAAKMDWDLKQEQIALYMRVGYE